MATVTSVDGLLADGKLITVRGTDFGANGPTVRLFDDFEAGTNGVTVDLTKPNLGQWTYRNGTESDTMYYNGASVSGSLAVRFDATSFTDNPNLVAQNASTFDEFYVSAWAMLPTGSAATQAQWKSIWVTPAYNGDTGSDSNSPCIAANATNWWHWFGNVTPFATLYPDSFLYPSAPDYGMAENLWTRMAWWVVGRTDTTGRTSLWFTDATNNTWEPRSFTNIQTIYEAETEFWQDVDINAYVYQRDNSYQIWDDVYIAMGSYARATVEIGDASSYAACTKLTMCTTPLGAAGAAWSDKQIQCTVRAGNISAGTNYLYVTDASGNRSAGFPITFGSHMGSGKTAGIMMR